MSGSAVRYLIVPGWQGSPADHWQTHWQHCLPNARRVEQQNWAFPERNRWVQELHQVIQEESGPIVVIAHSLGCITLAHWAHEAPAQALQRVRGALLVAPADVERSDCPKVLHNFAPIPRTHLPFASLVVGSDNDPAATPLRALELARDWNSEAAILVGVGHINVKSGHHCWEQGFAHLYRLQNLIEQRARRRA